MITGGHALLQLTNTLFAIWLIAVTFIADTAISSLQVFTYAIPADGWIDQALVDV
jgi:hypothetical protein